MVQHLFAKTRTYGREAFDVLKQSGQTIGDRKITKLRHVHERLLEGSVAERPLDLALGQAILAWGAGWFVGQMAEVPSEAEDLKKELEAADLPALIGEALESMSVEAVVLDRTQAGKGKYRVLDAVEIEPVLEAHRP